MTGDDPSNGCDGCVIKIQGASAHRFAMIPLRRSKRLGSEASASDSVGPYPDGRRRRVDQGIQTDLPPAEPHDIDDVLSGHIPCEACHQNIPPAENYIIVQPCMHILCQLCTIKSQVERGCEPHKCPVGNCNCFSTAIEFVHCGGDGTDHPTIIANPVVGSENFIRQHLPIHWLKQQHDDALRESSNNEGIVISCTKLRRLANSKYEKKTITSTFKDELIERIYADAANEGISTKVSRGELPEDTMFQLSVSVRENERYNSVT